LGPEKTTALCAKGPKVGTCPRESFFSGKLKNVQDGRFSTAKIFTANIFIRKNFHLYGVWAMTVFGQ
jgi:hypothetical protein